MPSRRLPEHPCHTGSDGWLRVFKGKLVNRIHRYHSRDLMLTSGAPALGLPPPLPGFLSTFGSCNPMVVLAPHALPYPAMTVGFDSKDYALLYLEFSSTSKMADSLTDAHSVMLSIRDQQEAAE